MEQMNILISTEDGLASFSDFFFDEDQADKMKAFAEGLGYKVTIEKTDQEFCSYLNPLKRQQIRDIDWQDYRNILYLIKNRNKSDYDITKGLGSEGSGMAVLSKMRKVLAEYTTFTELEGNNITEEQLETFAKSMVNKFQVTSCQVKKKIEKLKGKGCSVGSADEYPECQNGFHKDCFLCPHNKDANSPIKNDVDIKRFNEELKKDGTYLINKFKDKK
ncbi:MAG: hypothetical protein GY861_17180 [bacterium]|nr:hypothetical protein [bacterium]